MNDTIAAAVELDITFIRGFDVPYGRNAIYEAFRRFSLAVSQFTVSVNIKRSRRARNLSVALDFSTKSRLRHLLNLMKETVEKLEVSDAKREALIAKITALETEINRDRTRLEQVTALWLEICTKTGEGVEKLEPLRKWMESIGELIGGAKSGESTTTLPKQPPQKQIPDLNKNRSPPPIDDDIPF